MNAQQQWRQIDGAYKPDFVRELPRDDERTAKFADGVDTWAPVVGWIITVVVILCVTEGVIR